MIQRNLSYLIPPISSVILFYFANLLYDLMFLYKFRFLWLHLVNCIFRIERRDRSRRFYAKYAFLLKDNLLARLVTPFPRKAARTARRRGNYCCYFHRNDRPFARCNKVAHGVTHVVIESERLRYVWHESPLYAIRYANTLRSQSSPAHTTTVVMYILLKKLEKIMSERVRGFFLLEIQKKFQYLTTI